MLARGPLAVPLSFAALCCSAPLAAHRRLFFGPHFQFADRAPSLSLSVRRRLPLAVPLPFGSGLSLSLSQDADDRSYQLHAATNRQNTR